MFVWFVKHKSCSLIIFLHAEFDYDLHEKKNDISK